MDQVALRIDGLRQPLKKALHTAGRLAFDGVQICARNGMRPRELTDTGIRQLRKMLDDLNLRVSSVCLPTRSGISSPHRAEQRAAALKDAMQMASRLHSRLLLTNLGELPADASAGRAMLTDMLGELSKYGLRVGVEIALMTPDAPPAEVGDFVSGLPERAVGLDLNPAELIAHRQSPGDYVGQLGEYVLHVHASDAVSSSGASGAEAVELGRGSADIPALMGQLEEHNFRGWVTAVPRGGPNVEDEMSNSIAFLRSL